jgi:hypothetical protein
MGFWGSFAVYRSSEPLTTLAAFLPVEAEPCIGPWHTGWQVWRVHDREGDFFDQLTEHLSKTTGAPVMLGQVLDSDGVHVRGSGPASGQWQIWLHLDRALGHLCPPPAPFDEDDNYLGDDWTDPDYEEDLTAERQRWAAVAPGGVTGAQRAIDLAVEAGLSPKPAEKVAAIIDGQAVFAEELFFDLLEALGFSDPASPSH